MSVWLPTSSAVPGIVTVAVPPESVPVPRTVSPSRTWTSPVTSRSEVTVAVTEPSVP